MHVLLASNNPHKAKEFTRIFSASGLRVSTPAALGLAALDVVEDGPTFAHNARAKALAYWEAYRMPALADDSGICVDALAGSPGVRSARFGTPDLDDAGRMRYLLSCLINVPSDRRGAHYQCVLALALPGGALIEAAGACYGAVASAARHGPTGFGYDPVFVPCGYDATVAALSPDEKDALSHRGKAARRLLAALHHFRPASGTLEV